MPVPSHLMPGYAGPLRLGVRKLRNRCTNSLETGVQKPPKPSLKLTTGELPVHPAVERIVHEEVRQYGRDDSPNAIANFEFDVALPYRRGEKLFETAAP